MQSRNTNGMSTANHAQHETITNKLRSYKRKKQHDH